MDDSERVTDERRATASDAGATAQLRSVLRSALRDVPTALRDPSTAGRTAPVTATALGAILSGEPRRALAVIAAHEGKGATQELGALRHLATVLCLNWWPGDTGAVQTGDAGEVAGISLTPTGDLRTDLHLVLAARTQPGLLSLRSIVRSGARIDPARARDSVRILSQDEHNLLQAASGVDVAPAADLAVGLADLYRPGGANLDAEAYLSWAPGSVRAAR